jgi:hypothetical protein
MFWSWPSRCQVKRSQSKLPRLTIIAIPLLLAGCASASNFAPGRAGAQQFSADQLRCRQLAASEAEARADAADRGGDGEGGASEIGSGIATMFVARNERVLLYNACMRQLGYSEH